MALEIVAGAIRGGCATGAAGIVMDGEATEIAAGAMRDGRAGSAAWVLMDCWIECLSLLIGLDT